MKHRDCHPQTESLSQCVGLATRFVEDGDALSFAEALERLEHSEAFREVFSQALRDAPYGAYRFETPALSKKTANDPFEFVLLRDNYLDRPASPSSFAEHFGDCEATVTTFNNLGKDAFLIVPVPLGGENRYAHLAGFMRSAPHDQTDALWRCAAAATRARIGRRPLWLNTAGDGVPWLHVRIDSRPKYYRHQPYANGVRTARP